MIILRIRKNSENAGIFSGVCSSMWHILSSFGGKVNKYLQILLGHIWGERSGTSQLESGILGSAGLPCDPLPML